ncbi:MAG: site-specific integrase [Candidatus Dormibacteraceae bacterium]
MTWDEAVLAWLEDHAEGRKSIEEIKRVLRWLTVHLRGLPLTDITDLRIRDVAKARRAEPTNRAEIARAAKAGRDAPGPKPTSGATVNRHLAQLSAILHYAHRRGWLPAVPPIAKAAEPAKRVAWITREQADDLLAELPPHLAAIAGFALATGLRESNIRLLKWKQVDQQRAIAWFEADEMKGGRTHTVPLNADALRVLATQRGKHKTWVFPVPRWETGEDGKGVLVEDSPTTKVSNHAWSKACERAGLPWLRFHDLRHTWASWHVQKGTPLPVLQELGGWKSLAMVQRYAHLGVSHVAAWAGNVTAAGTNPAQLHTGVANENGPEGPSTEGNEVGWLMGLEPTTTRITRRSSYRSPSKISDLAARRKRKSA